jgi:hypothetical protein
MEYNGNPIHIVSRAKGGDETVAKGKKGKDKKKKKKGGKK